MSIKSEKNVVQFKISVYDTILVEILQGQANLGSVEPGLSDQHMHLARLVLTVRAWSRTVLAEYAASNRHH
jgi:hypothetical protein